MIRPGTVANAIILPRANSDPVSLKTSQLTAIRLKPNPNNDVMLPKKIKERLVFLKLISN